jgi:diacylglycerol kinase
MKTLLKSHHPVRHIKSFHFAFKGIFHTLLNEANFRVQVVIVIVTLFLGYHYSISHIEWGLLIICIGMLLSAEMINTVVEEVTDNFIKEYHEGARIIKDVSAGFVLITAFTYLFIFLLIFGSKFLGFFI